MKRFAILGSLVSVLLSVQPACAEISTGSGFFITKDGYFVTNFHVIEGAKEISIHTSNGKPLPADIVRVDKANDLAILKVDGNHFPLAITNSRSVKRGQRVITVGYPHVDVQGFEPKVTDGIVNSLSGIRDDPRVFQISVPVQSGNSGGPLVTQEGNVVGIVVSKLSAVGLFKETGDLPQNVNYAVKSNYLLEVVTSISGLEEKLASPSQKRFKETGDLATSVEMSTALVVARSSESSSYKPPQAVATPMGVPQNEEMAIINASTAMSNVTEDRSLYIRAPDIAENGAVVPVEVTAPRTFTSGERLYLVVNDRFIGASLTPYGSRTQLFLSTRVEMPATGLLKAVLVDASGHMRIAAKEVRVTIGADPNQVGGLPKFDSMKMVATNKNGNLDIKSLINSSQNPALYVKSIDYFVDGTKVAEVGLTPGSAMNPYVGIRISGSGGGVEMQARASNGQSNNATSNVNQ